MALPHRLESLRGASHQDSLHSSCTPPATSEALSPAQEAPPQATANSTGLMVPRDSSAARTAAAAAFLSLPLPKAWVREPSRLRAAGRVSLGLSIWSFGVSFILFVLAIVAAESLVDYVAAFLEVVCAAVIAYFGASAAFKRDWRSAGVYVAFALLMAAEQLLWVVFAVYHVKATKAQLTAVDRLSSAATEEEYLLLQEELTVAAAQLGLSIFSLASYCTSAAAAYGLRYQALVLGPGSHAAAAKSFADVAADALAAADAEDAAAVREGRRPTQRISVQHQLLQHQLNLLQQEQLEQQQLLLLRQEELMLQRIPRRHQQIRRMHTDGAATGVHVEAGEAPDAW
ncbi:fk506-binding nuclear protein [Cyclospora cayetanensis]|uniref:Fk506-binding nuclear protein n=1 Tax=Cyclospora cayetanensis TaxID=88456 RepID=A0A1D3D5F3_9EIME|nr:fk506-binding nuclear protein [Cyclospora cayetanensis]